jgi:AcrR family transcriptional regulator
MVMDVRTKIISAGREMSAERGFHRINMADLAARAGVSKRTVYRYFPGKEAVIEATLANMMAQVSQSLTHLLEEEHDPALILTSLQKILLQHGAFAINPRSIHDLQHYYPHLWQKIERFRQEQLETALGVIAAKCDASQLNPIDFRIAKAVILGSIQAVLNPDFVLSNNLTFEDAVRQLSTMLLFGWIPLSNQNLNPALQ